MKKIVIFILIIILLSGCSNKSAKPIDNNTKNVEEIKEEVKEEYIDNNPIKLGFYLKDSSGTKLNLINNYDCKWIQYKDLVWFSVYPTNLEQLPNNGVKSLWQTYWQDYINKNYKFGIELSYYLTNGEYIHLKVLKHSDNNRAFNYIQMYIYDGYNVTTSWYDHLEDDEFNDNTVITSIKLTGSVYLDQVFSPITLKVFTYDGLDDFDENGYYRGNSYATVTVNKT